MFNANNTIVVFCVFADNEICEHYKECISVTYDFYEKMLEFISDMKVDIPGFKNIYTERDFVSDDDISKYWKREDAPENSGKHFYDQLKSICTEHNLNLSENMKKADFVDHHDHFTNSTPESEWQSCLEHADKIGLGSRDYELIVC